MAKTYNTMRGNKAKRTDENGKKSLNVHKRLSKLRTQDRARNAILVGVLVIAGSMGAMVSVVVLQTKSERPRVLGAETVDPVVMYKKDELEQRIVFWEEVLELQPGYVPAYVKLAEYHWQKGNKQEAREYLSVAEKLDPNRGGVVELEELLVE